MAKSLCWIFCVLVVTPLLSACGKPAITTEKGWKRYDMEASRFSIAVPEGWTELNKNSDNLDEVLATVKKSNPNLAYDLEATVHNTNEQIKLRIFDITDETLASNYLPGIYVAQLPNTGSMTLDQHLAEELISLQTRYKDILTSTVHASQTTLPAGDALTLEFSFRLTRPSGDIVEDKEIEYKLVIDDDYYVVNTHAKSEQFEKYAGTFQKIAESFRRLNKNDETR